MKGKAKGYAKVAIVAGVVVVAYDLAKKKAGK